MVTQEWETLEELQGIHIIDADDVLDPSELYNKIEPYLDYDIYYAEDRIKQIEDNWDDELYARCVSTDKFRGQQVKKTTSLLSENTPMTFHLDKLSDYILYAHYDNEEQEKEFQRISQEAKEIREKSAKEKTATDEKKLIDNQDKIKARPRMMTRQLSDKQKKEDIDSLQYFFETGDTSSLEREPSLLPAINYTSVDKELNQKGHFKNSKRYWMHYAKPKGNRVPHYHGELIPYARLAYESLDSYEKDIKKIEKKIEEIEFFRFIEKQRLNNWNGNSELILKEGETEELNPVLENKKRELTKIKTQLRGEYNITAETLRKRVVLSGSSVSPGEVVSDDAWERMSLRDPEVYLALILGYSELTESYSSKVGTTMWCLLHDFEDMLKRIDLVPIETLVLDALLTNGRVSDKEIQQSILKYLHKDIPQQTINNIVNNLLPSRFSELYEQQLEDWVWIHRRKGVYKRCKRCNEIKLTKHFSVDSRNDDGFHAFCKLCRAKNR